MAAQEWKTLEAEAARIAEEEKAKRKLFGATIFGTKPSTLDAEIQQTFAAFYVDHPNDRIPTARSFLAAVEKSLAGAFITEIRRTATDTGDGVGPCDACKNRNPEDPIDHPELAPIATARLKYLEKA